MENEKGSSLPRTRKRTRRSFSMSIRSNFVSTLRASFTTSNRSNVTFSDTNTPQAASNAGPSSRHPSQTAPSLFFFCIYKQPAAMRASADTPQHDILLFHPHTFTENDRLKHVGLAQALVGFSQCVWRIFTNSDP